MSDYVNWQQFYDLNAPSIAERESAMDAEQRDIDAGIGALERRAKGDIERGNAGRQLMDYNEYADLMRRQQAQQSAWQNRGHLDSLLGNQRPQGLSAYAQGAQQRVGAYGQTMAQRLEAAREKARTDWRAGEDARNGPTWDQRRVQTTRQNEQRRWDQNHGVGQYNTTDATKYQSGAQGDSGAYSMSDDEIRARAKARGDYRPEDY